MFQPYLVAQSQKRATGTNAADAEDKTIKYDNCMSAITEIKQKCIRNNFIHRDYYKCLLAVSK